MELDNYIWNRLRADSAHAIALAEAESAVQHAGLRGRLREILISNLLAPWLPPLCRCVTGTIVDSKKVPRRFTQDDIIVIDPSFAPPILAGANTPDGIFLFNSVLLRIEVKSTLSKEDIEHFVDSSVELSRMQFTKQEGCEGSFVNPHNILVAFKSSWSNDEWDYELRKMCEIMKEKKIEPLDGIISGLCVVDKGFWFVRDSGKGERSWCRLDSDNKEERLAWLVGKASNTTYRTHVQRQGRDPSQGLEVGIGTFMPKQQIFEVDIAELLS